MPDPSSAALHAPRPAGDVPAFILRPSVIYAKTARGHEEVAMRSFGLTPKQRRVLIMMNGKKDLAAIAGFVPLSELREAVPFLLAEVFIADTAEDAASKEEEDVPDGKERADHGAALVPIKQMMTAAASRHLGLLAGDIVRRIESAGDRAALRSAAGYWHVAILESKTGADKAGIYLDEVRRAIAAL